MSAPASDLPSSNQVQPAPATPPTRRGDLTFIETQFPVSKLSMESYKERKSNYSQTLTGLGKWWGRKPLVLCRATILGLLLPSTDDSQKDREVFLRLMTMDDGGLLRRKTKRIPIKELYRRLPPTDRTRYFKPESTETGASFKRGVSREDKEELQQRVFLSLAYDERLEYCDRPEQVDGPSFASWKVINEWLAGVYGPPTGAEFFLGEMIFPSSQRDLASSIPSRLGCRYGQLICGGAESSHSSKIPHSI